MWAVPFPFPAPPRVSAMAFPAATDRRWAWAAAGFAAGVGAGLLLPAVWGGPRGGPTVELVPGAAKAAATDDDVPAAGAGAGRRPGGR